MKKIKLKKVDNSYIPEYVFGGRLDRFGDSVSVLCLKCEITLYVRPYTPKPKIGYLCDKCVFIETKGEFEATIDKRNFQETQKRYGDVPDWKAGDGEIEFEL